MFENFALKCPEFDKANEGFSHFSRFPLSGHLNKMHVFQILTLTFSSLKHKKYGYLICHWPHIADIKINVCYSKNDTVFPSVTIQNFKQINYVQYIPSSDKFVNSQKAGTLSCIEPVYVVQQESNIHVIHVCLFISIIQSNKILNNDYIVYNVYINLFHLPHKVVHCMSDIV